MSVFLLSSAVGYGVIVVVVLLAAVIYTIIKLRKQVKEAEDVEINKKNRKD